MDPEAEQDDTQTDSDEMPTAAPASAYTPSRQNNGITIAAVVILLVVCCGGGMAVISAMARGDGQSSAAPAAHVKPTATPHRAQPTATATTDPRLDAYTSMVITDLAMLAPAMQQTATDCQAEDLPACRDDLQQVRDLTTAFLADLDATPPPPCLYVADGKLRQALTDLGNGAQLGVTGIDNSDAHEIDDGTTLVIQGGNELGQATTAVQQAQCH